MRKHESTMSISYLCDSLYNVCLQGFNPLFVPTSYGSDLHVWDWKARKQIQKLQLGSEGLIPLELRFLHDPDSCHGFVGAALASNIIHFTKVSTRTQPRCCSGLLRVVRPLHGIIWIRRRRRSNERREVKFLDECFSASITVTRYQQYPYCTQIVQHLYIFRFQPKHPVSAVLNSLYLLRFEGCLLQQSMK